MWGELVSDARERKIYHDMEKKSVEEVLSDRNNLS